MSDQTQRLKGKAALVTGSSRGIGRAIALRFASEGASLAINYRTDDADAQDVADRITQAGGRALLMKQDLAEIPALGGLVARAAAAFGSLDVLVNNAGVESFAPFWDIDEAAFDTVLDVDLKAAFFLTQAFVRHLRGQGKGGSVVNISSVHENVAFPGFAAYCVAKGGLRMLTRTLAVELGPLGIRINGIAPGAIRTEINEDLLDDVGRSRALTRQIPLGRVGTPGDVAAIAAFLASDDSGYVTGSTYDVDGGLSRFYHEEHG